MQKFQAGPVESDTVTSTSARVFPKKGKFTGLAVLIVIKGKIRDDKNGKQYECPVAAIQGIPAEQDNKDQVKCCEIDCSFDHINKEWIHFSVFCFFTSLSMIFMISSISLTEICFSFAKKLTIFPKEFEK